MLILVFFLCVSVGYSHDNSSDKVQEISEVKENEMKEARKKVDRAEDEAKK